MTDNNTRNRPDLNVDSSHQIDHWLDLSQPFELAQTLVESANQQPPEGSPQSNQVNNSEDSEAAEDSEPSPEALSEPNTENTVSDEQSNVLNQAPQGESPVTPDAVEFVQEDQGSTVRKPETEKNTIEDDGHNRPNTTEFSQEAFPFSVPGDVPPPGVLTELAREFIPDPVEPIEVANNTIVCGPPGDAISYEAFNEGFEDFFGLEQPLDITVVVNDADQLSATLGMMNTLTLNETRDNVTIFLNEGTYALDETLLVTMQSGDTINFEACDCANTILDGQSETRIMRIENQGNVNISGISFINGQQFGDGLGPGGAITTISSGILNIYDSCFTDNIGSNGGAIANLGGLIGNIVDSEFNNNSSQSTAGSGGALFNAGTIFNIEGTVFNSNNAIDNHGGAITNQLRGEIGSISNSIFVGNFTASTDGESGYDGGAIQNFGIINNITQSSFVDNSADDDGGAINNSNTISNIDEVEFIRNHAKSSGDEGGFSGTGGAIENTIGGVISNISNSLFLENLADEEGGAIDNDGEATLILGVNNDFIRNVAISDGGAISNSGMLEMPVNPIRFLTPTFTQDELTLFDGNRVTSGDGGAIFNDANFTGSVERFSGIDGVFTNNMASNEGGAIYISSGSTFTSAIVSGTYDNNSAGENGGAIANYGVFTGAGSEVVMAPMSFFDITPDGIHGIYTNNRAEVGGAIYNDGSFSNIAALTGTYTGNRAINADDTFSATNRGGAIYNSGTIGSVNGPGIINTVITENQAFDGGGIYNDINAHIESLSNNTLAFNKAVNDGGGFYNNGAEEGGLGTITNAINNTISNNTAGNNGGGGYNAGGIGDLRFATIAFNSADGAGGGLYYLNSPTAGFGELNDSIVARNSGNDDLEGQGFIASGYNIIGSVQGSDFMPTFFDMVSLLDATPFDPMIDSTLALNGDDRHLTHALLPGSPAIDGTPTTSTVDVRFFQRQIDGNGDAFVQDDIGSFELGATVDLLALLYFLPPIVLDLDGDGVELVSANQSPVTLGIGQSGVQMGWVSADDGILVYDVNSDGVVNALSEITLSSYHPDAMTDLQGLRLAFDSNQDNVFDDLDAAFSDFGVWQDINQNGISEQGEFQTLVEAGIESIDLNAVENVHWDEGNLVFGEGHYTLADGSQATFADVALSAHDVISEQGPFSFDLNDSVVVEESGAISTPLLAVGFSLDDPTIDVSL